MPRITYRICGLSYDKENRSLGYEVIFDKCHSREIALEKFLEIRELNEKESSDLFSKSIERLETWRICMEICKNYKKSDSKIDIVDSFVLHRPIKKG